MAFEISRERIVQRMLMREGDSYVMGAENPLNEPLYRGATDCSELVQWACYVEGLFPTMPDGAYYQWMHCLNHATVISVAEAIETRGALLFVKDPYVMGYDSVPHVAMSLGQGSKRTIEARGRAWGVGIFSAVNRFHMAALIPGVDYNTLPFQLNMPTEEDEDMATTPDDFVAVLDVPGGTPGVDVWKLKRNGGIFTEGSAVYYGSYPELDNADEDSVQEDEVPFEALTDYTSPSGVQGYACWNRVGHAYRFPLK